MTRQELLAIAKPILFNTEMTKAVLDNRKTVTRRLLKIKYKDDECGFQIITNASTGNFVRVEMVDEDECGIFADGTERYATQPYYIGDYLYVRETGLIQFMKAIGRKVKMLFKADSSLVEFEVSEKEYNRLLKYEHPKNKWLSPYWLTKETARIFLRVTNIKVERLQDITEEQAVKEGCSKPTGHCKRAEYPYICEYQKLWDIITPKKDLDCYGWDANPYVWVIEFERVETDG